jgi:hypothetical protein
LKVTKPGIGTSVKEDSGLNIVILRGYETSYTVPKPAKDQVITQNTNSDCTAYNVIDGFVPGVGDSLALISVLQARNGARAIFSGSSEFFSDDFIHQSTSNLKLIQNLGEWLLNRRGQVRVKELGNRKLRGEEQETYTIRDSLVRQFKPQSHYLGLFGHIRRKEKRRLGSVCIRESTNGASTVP